MAKFTGYQLTYNSPSYLVLFSQKLTKCRVFPISFKHTLTFVLLQDREKLSDDEVIKLLSNYSVTWVIWLLDRFGHFKGLVCALVFLILILFLFNNRKEKFKQHIIPGTLQISLKTYNEGITSKLLYKNWTLFSQNYPRKKVSHIALEPLRVFDSYTQPLLLFIVWWRVAKGGGR